MYNLKKKLRNLTQIEDWHDAEKNNTNYLSSIFEDVLGQNNIFFTIYVAIRDNPTSQYEEENPTYQYINVGFSIDHISDYFNTRYGMNYFLYDYKIESDYNKLRQRINAIYRANFYKYKKLIEVLGYNYNPLYNVDGTELYSNMESIGDSSTTRKPNGTIRSTSGTLDGNTIGDSTTTDYENPADSNASTDPSYIKSKTKQTPITTDQNYINYQDESKIDNEPAQKFIKDSGTGTITKAGLYNMAAKDSAFGVSLDGAERYYAEKRIRQGNIGVTKSTELIEAQREAVRYNILDEFFRDLERDIVVGIY